ALSCRAAGSRVGRSSARRTTSAPRRRTAPPIPRKWRRPFTTGWGFRSSWNCRARKGGRSRWSSAVPSRLKNCSFRISAMLRYLFLLMAQVLATAAFAADLTILPGSVDLDGPEAYEQLLAEASVEGHQEDWTRTAQWTSSDPNIAKVDQTGVVRPVADGQATITAKSQGRSASLTVRVKNAHAPFAWTFRNDVIPVLTKMGCNSGACHGASAGKNGFKLTLRGYDPDADYDALTRVSIGRRVSLSEPSHSLMLLKPTFAVPHGGGKRFSTDSLEYRVISEWIAAGAPRPAEQD